MSLNGFAMDCFMVWDQLSKCTSVSINVDFSLGPGADRPGDWFPQPGNGSAWERLSPHRLLTFLSWKGTGFQFNSVSAWESEFKVDDQPSFTKPTQRMSERKRLIGLMALNTNLWLNGQNTNKKLQVRKHGHIHMHSHRHGRWNSVLSTSLENGKEIHSPVWAQMVRNEGSHIQLTWVGGTRKKKFLPKSSFATVIRSLKLIPLPWANSISRETAPGIISDTLKD